MASSTHHLMGNCCDVPRVCQELCRFHCCSCRAGHNWGWLIAWNCKFWNHVQLLPATHSRRGPMIGFVFIEHVHSRRNGPKNWPILYKCLSIRCFRRSTCSWTFFHWHCWWLDWLALDLYHWRLNCESELLLSHSETFLTCFFGITDRRRWCNRIFRTSKYYCNVQILDHWGEKIRTRKNIPRQTYVSHWSRRVSNA